jgi:hypothetical protein
MPGTFPDPPRILGDQVLQGWAESLIGGWRAARWPTVAAVMNAMTMPVTIYRRLTA